MRTRPTISAPAGLAALALCLTLALPGAAAAQAAEPSMLEAMLASFTLEGRQVYLSPTLMSPPGTMGRALHPKEEMAVTAERFGARVATPEEALSCGGTGAGQACTLPERAILFQVLMPPVPIQGGRLPVRVLVFTNRAAGGEVELEAWDFVLLNDARGWSVVQRAKVEPRAG